MVPGLQTLTLPHTPLAQMEIIPFGSTLEGYMDDLKLMSNQKLDA